MLGDGVYLGETFEKGIEREVFEETRIKAQVDRLAVVCENIFKGIEGMIDGLDCHTMEFYYIMKMKEDNVNMEDAMTDDAETLVWLPIEEIPNNEIKPSFIKGYIDEIINGKNVLHIIWEKDR